MIVYKDKISGDDMFTDVYPIQDHGVFYKVIGKMETEKSEFDERAIGANPSAEEAGDVNTTDSVTGCNIVLANRLLETFFDKKSYKTYIAGYMKKIRDLVPPEEKEEFMAKMQAAIKDVFANFKNYKFYQGESADPDGMASLMDYLEDDQTPYMLFFKAGLDEEKL